MYESFVRCWTNPLFRFLMYKIIVKDNFALHSRYFKWRREEKKGYSFVYLRIEWLASASFRNVDWKLYLFIKQTLVGNAKWRI